MKAFKICMIAFLMLVLAAIIISEIFEMIPNVIADLLIFYISLCEGYLVTTTFYKEEI